MQPNKEVSKSYMMLIGAMLIYGTIGIFRSYIPVSSALLACIRGIIGTVFLCVFVKLKGRRIFAPIGKKAFILLMITGALIGVNWIFLFEAYRFTSVATATLCYYMEPTILILLSPIVLKEKLTAKRIICAFVALTGMVFVSGIIDSGGITYGETKGIIFGLAAALLYAIIILINKKIEIDDAYEKTIIQLAFAAIALIPYILLTEDITKIDLNTVQIILVIIVGIVHTGIAYALYFTSIQHLKAQSIAILSYIDPVFALILSALILKEHMSVLGIVGAVLIIGSSIVSEVSFKKKDIMYT